MLQLVATLVARMRGDRGEVGPIGYTIMVAGIVVLAILVVGWGQSIADYFMSEVELGDGGGGDGGGGDGGGGDGGGGGD